MERTSPVSNDHWSYADIAMMTTTCIARVTPFVGPSIEIIKAKIDGNRAHARMAMIELAIEISGALLVPMAGTTIETAFAIYVTIVSTIALFRMLTEDTALDPTRDISVIAAHIREKTGIPLPERFAAFNASIIHASHEAISGIQDVFKHIHGRFLLDLERRYPRTA